MSTVLIRTAIIYVLFTCAIRFMGKRQVGEMQLSELITTFMLSELAINPIQDISIPISYSIIPLIFLFSMEVITSFISTKSSVFKRIFNGSPSIIIKNGILNQRELARLRISISELLSELRLKDVCSISDVDYAILEQNGKLSVFLKESKKTLTVEDIREGGKRKSASGIDHSVIIDAEINYSELDASGKSEKWLLRELKSRSLDIKRVFLFTVDDANNINIIIKEEK